MNQGLVETIKAFDDFHRRLPTDKRTYEYLWMARWPPLEGHGYILWEYQEMDLLLGTFRKGKKAVRKYVEERADFDCDLAPNTITCGMYLPKERGKFTLAYPLRDDLAFHNETIPDHFLTILSMGGTTTPFHYLREAGITTQFFQELQAKTREILERCRDVKFRILDSNRKFSAYHQDGKFAKGKKLYRLELLYLLEEARELEIVEEITDDMKNVYNTVETIIQGVLKQAKERGDLTDN